MSVFLLHIEEIFWIDGRVLASIRESEGLPFSPPLLSPLKPGEELFLYLVVSPATINAALIKEEDKVQKPMYYADRALRGADERYLPMEKLAFALVTAAYKLKAYFQDHTVVFLTDKLLRRAMINLKAAKWMALWAIELSEFDI